MSTQSQKLTIPPENSNQRLDVFLFHAFPVISRSQWQKRIKAGQVLVNKQKKIVHYFLRAGDIVEVKSQNSKVKVYSKIKNANFKLIKIIKEDKDYLAINKPSGIIVHPDNVNQQNTLVDWLREKYSDIKGVGYDLDRPGIVHRLDKNVSGLMIIARNQPMFDNLKQQFHAREVSKEYLALVHNQMKQDQGKIKLPIKRSKSKGIWVADTGQVSDGRPAITEYEVMRKFRNYTLLKVKILTGRTHQIRVHLRSIGHPVVGDKLYITHDIKKKKPVQLDRLWLFASKLGFKDLDGNYQEFEIKMPVELKKFLEKVK